MRGTSVIKELMLRYLASGESYTSLEYQFRISRKAISCIIDEVAKTMVKILGKEILKTPTATEEWEEISTKFMQRWNFPNEIGAVNGKHIVIQQLKNSRLHCRNYNVTGSIILLGMIAPEYKFLYADVGMSGRNSDRGNWSQNRLKNALKNKTLNLPGPRA